MAAINRFAGVWVDGAAPTSRGFTLNQLSGIWISAPPSSVANPAGLTFNQLTGLWVTGGVEAAVVVPPFKSGDGSGAGGSGAAGGLGHRRKTEEDDGIPFGIPPTVGEKYLADRAAYRARMNAIMMQEDEEILLMILAGLDGKP